MALIGPGTGLGVSGLVPAGGDTWVALAGEGGHVTLPATTPREAAVIEQIRQRHGHPSAERAISGAGLVTLYEGVCALDGAAAPCRPRRPMSAARALAGTCPHSREAVCTCARCWAASPATWR